MGGAVSDIPLAVDMDGTLILSDMTKTVSYTHLTLPTILLV